MTSSNPIVLLLPSHTCASSAEHPENATFVSPWDMKPSPTPRQLAVVSLLSLAYYNFALLTSHPQVALTTAIFVYASYFLGHALVYLNQLRAAQLPAFYVGLGLGHTIILLALFSGPYEAASFLWLDSMHIVVCAALFVGQAVTSHEELLYVGFVEDFLEEDYDV